MQTIRNLVELRVARAALAGSVALVPTMGALHAGHSALIAEARRLADHVVASIFVNPMQFAAGEDLSRYPRREASDAATLADAGVALLWAPDVATMYPARFATTVSVTGLDAGQCGAARPGHFDGVATVVLKLFDQVRPDVAVFGEKDWQQLAIIRRMVVDLDIALTIHGCPTQRDADGVALSSRNVYLTDDERRSARMVPRALGEAVAAIADGASVTDAVQHARTKLMSAGFEVEYVEVVDADLRALDAVDRAQRIMVAVRIGSTRLIDNLPIAR